ncbi:MAG: hypothetical protein JRN52_06110 [Nitrososphaerota archaeon]|nr:hypothetical protein [Nitrososphaerota archaeon]
MGRKKKAMLPIGRAYKFNDWIIIEEINASYNPVTEHVIFNLGEGFSTLATEDMQEFLKSLVTERKE